MPTTPLQHGPSAQLADAPAGLIGEIASYNENGHTDRHRYRMWEKEVEIFQAVTDAQRRTGLFIMTHASCGHHGMAQLRVIADGGGGTTCVIIGHCDAQPHDDPALDFLA